MTQPDYFRSPKHEQRETAAPAPFDRTPDQDERRVILRHWANHKSVLEIGTMLRLRYATVERVLGISEDR